MMLSIAGFVVHDFGIDIVTKGCIEVAREHKADIVGMLALLATTMVNIEMMIKAFE